MSGWDGWPGGWVIVGRAGGWERGEGGEGG